MTTVDRFYKRLLEALYDGVYYVDQCRNITFWNRCAEQITGYEAEEVLGRCCGDNILVHVNGQGDELCTGLCPVAQTLIDGRMREAPLLLHHKDGHRVPVLVRVAPIYGENGEIQGVVELFTEHIEKLAALHRVEELEQVTLLCPLTRLANRSYTELYLQKALDEFHQYGWPFGVVSIDVDNIEAVEREHGPIVRDNILRMVAKTLAGNLRSFDLAGRWDDKQFLVVAPNVTADALKATAEHCRICIANSFLPRNGGRLDVTASFGTTLARKGDTLDGMLRRAASYAAISQRDGGNRITTDATEQ